MSYVYPGSRRDFYTEFGGLPDRSLGLTNIFIIFIIVLLVIVIVVALLIWRTRNQTIFIDHEGLVNLDLLIDLNNPTIKCCVFPGSTAPNQQYLYDPINAITYSRQKPSSINTVCSSFPNPTTCISENTNDEGEIVPRATFAAIPYYTFEYGLFIGCENVTAC